MDFHSWILSQQASKMNAAGVEAFASGHYALAVEYLNNALVIINKLLLLHCDQYDLANRTLRTKTSQQQRTPDSSRNTATTTTTGAGNTRSSPRHQHQGSISGDDTTAKPKSVEINSLQDERFYIYNQALLFDTAVPSCSFSLLGPFLVLADGSAASFQEIRKHYIQISFHWSIVHFNMALVLHKLIHETEENDRRYREETILFYKLCLQNLWVVPATSGTMNLLMLSAVNNLAHVYLNLHKPTASCLAGGSIHVDSSIVSFGSGKETRNTLNGTDSSSSSSSKRGYHQPFFLNRMDNDTAAAQKELVQTLLLRAIGKVILYERSFTPEEQHHVTEMSINHIVVSALNPSYVAPGA